MPAALYVVFWRRAGTGAGRPYCADWVGCLLLPP